MMLTEAGKLTDLVFRADLKTRRGSESGRVEGPNVDAAVLLLLLHLHLRRRVADVSSLSRRAEAHLVTEDTTLRLSRVRSLKQKKSFDLNVCSGYFCSQKTQSFI